MLRTVEIVSTKQTYNNRLVHKFVIEEPGRTIKYQKELLQCKCWKSWL